MRASFPVPPGTPGVFRPFAGLLVSAIFLASACETPEPGETPCSSGEQRACYTGPEGTLGVGICRGGTQACVDGKWSEPCVGQILPAEEACNAVDDDCDGSIDDGATNACGHCEELAFQPGEACEACGSWTCDGEGGVTCVSDRAPPSETCTAESGCAGAWVCGEAGLVTCEAVEVRNGCDLCGGPDLPEKGAACTTAEGCSGTWVCNDAGDGLLCVGAVKNNCGLCGAAAVEGVGESCEAENGCPGRKECDSSGEGTVCAALSQRNQCGICGGPSLPDLGLSCFGAGGCPSEWTCAADGLSPVCPTAGRNNCGACDTPEVEGLDEACTAADLCAGRTECNEAGNGTVCVAAPPRNECHVCGAPVLDLEESCQDALECPGVRECTADGLGSECVAYPVTGAGDNCFTDGRCPGRFFCNAAGNGVECRGPETCDRPTDLLISEISLGRSGPNPGTGTNFNNQFIELYNPTDAEIDLAGYSVWIGPGKAVAFGAAPGTTRIKLQLTYASAGATKVPPRGYYLLAHATGYNGTVAPNATYSATLDHSGLPGSRPNSGQVWILRGTTIGAGDYGPDDVYQSFVADMMAYGSERCREGADPDPPNHPDCVARFRGELPALKHDTAHSFDAPPIASIERKAFANSTGTSMSSGGDAALGNGHDARDNRGDFVTRPVRDPQNASSVQEPPAP